MTPLESWATVAAIAAAMVVVVYTVNHFVDWLCYKCSYINWLRLEHWRKGRRF